MTRMMTLHNQTFRCTLQYHKTSLQQIFDVKILIFMLLHDNKSTNILYVTITSKYQQDEKRFTVCMKLICKPNDLKFFLWVIDVICL